MIRSLLVAPLLVGAALSSKATLAQSAGMPAEAQCQDGDAKPEGNFFKRAWYSVCRDFKRNNNWPDPFVAADRANTRVHFDLDTANGWRVQNTLGEQYFVDEGTQLTEAGRLKVAAIINQTPLCYRAIFVLRDPTPETTAGRVVSIQEAAVAVLGDRPPVPIFETYDKPRGAPAYYVDEVTRRYQATIPDPRLPEDDGSSSLSGGGGGSGSGNGQ
ncbi:MAG TPA: hypothetical protein VGN12_00690 [Pirellulales bacterium]|jgi:hypothetical protein